MEHTQNYLIVLFKNKIKKKIINKFKTHKKAQNLFKTLINDSDSVIFPKLYENGTYCEFELCLLEKTSGTFLPLFLKDEIGRQIKVDLDDEDYKITKIEKFRIEEEFLDYDNKCKITAPILIKRYLDKDGLKLVSKLNNKIIIQNDTDLNLFTLKNDDDSERFIDSMSEFFITKKRTDCLFVKDYSSSQRKYLYKLLTDIGYPKTYLQRHSTTHLSRK
jgi:hypothetical protein